MSDKERVTHEERVKAAGAAVRAGQDAFSMINRCSNYILALETELKEARGLMEAFVVSHRNNNPFALESFTSFLERTRHE